MKKKSQNAMRKLVKVFNSCINNKDEEIIKNYGDNLKSKIIGKIKKLKLIKIMKKITIQKVMINLIKKREKK